LSCHHAPSIIVLIVCKYQGQAAGLLISNSHYDNRSRSPYRPLVNNPSGSRRLFLLSCNMLTSLHRTAV